MTRPADLKLSGAVACILPAMLCCTVILPAIPARAADEGRGIGYAAAGPAFDLPDDMSMEQLVVHIALNSVRLAYVFKTSTSQTVHFSFALPDMPVDASPDVVSLGDTADGLRADMQPTNYLNLAVRINERSQLLTGHGRALFDGHDVTRQLLEAGVPLLYNVDGDAPWPHLPSAVQATLEADGLLAADAAQWTYQANFEWDYSFEPGETRLEVNYTPIANYWSDITLDAFPEIDPGGSGTRAYCIDDAVRRAFSRKPSFDLYTVTHLSAATPRSPVGHYRLLVDKGAAANLVAFCPLAAKKSAPPTFEWTTTNFTPGDETGVLFFIDPAALPE